MQETRLAPDLSVLENLFLPELGRRGVFAARPPARARHPELLGQAGLAPLETEVRHLSAAQRQLIEIARPWRWTPN